MSTVKWTLYLFRVTDHVFCSCQSIIERPRATGKCRNWQISGVIKHDGAADLIALITVPFRWLSSLPVPRRPSLRPLPFSLSFFSSLE